MSHSGEIRMYESAGSNSQECTNTRLSAKTISVADRSCPAVRDVAYNCAFRHSMGIVYQSWLVVIGIVNSYSCLIIIIII